MRHKFLEEIEKGIYESMLESIGMNESWASYKRNSDCGTIDVYVDDKNVTEVIVYPDNDKGQEYPNIIAAVEDVIPDWYDVEKDVEPYDYWNEHGFRDAVDYETWKFGHGGLR